MSRRKDLDVAPHGRERPFGLRAFDGPHFQHPKPAGDHIERCAELVGENREEVILGAVRYFGVGAGLRGLTIEARILHGQRDPARQVLGERQIRRVIRVRRRASHDHGPAQGLVHRDRHGHDRAMSELQAETDALLVARDGTNHFLRNIGREIGGPRPNHLADAVGRLDVDGLRREVAPSPLGLRGVAMLERQAADRTAGVRHEDRAPVGGVRNGEGSDA